MNTKASAMTGTGAAILLASFVWAGSAMAQSDTDVSNMARPADDLESCRAMNWNNDLLGTYPWVVDSCQAVVSVNGEKWARFEGKFNGMNRDGSFDAEFLNTSNRRVARVALTPAPEQRVTLDGTPTRFSDLKRGQVLSFYVPEGELGFAVEPGVPRSQLVKVAPAAKPMEGKDEPMQLAAAEPRSVKTESRLPTTAGPLPLVALGGLMSLLGGLGLTARRKARKQNS